MEIQHSPTSGWTATLRPHGASRWVSVAFLGAWLCGWFVGEAFALGAIVTFVVGFVSPSTVEAWGMKGDPTLGGTGLAVVLFLLIWTLLWTAGGIGALYGLCRALWGRDVLHLSQGRVEVTRHAWPFREAHAFARTALARIALADRGGPLRFETRTANVVVTDLGTRADREQLCRELHERLRPDEASAPPELPPRWASGRDERGDLLLFGNLRTRRQQAAAVTFAASLLLLSGARSLWRGHPSASALLLGLGALVALWALYLWVGRRQWVFAREAARLEHHFFAWHRTRELPSPSLALRWSRDSDGDHVCELELHSARGKRVLVRALDGGAEAHGLGRWLELHARLPFSR